MLRDVKENEILQAMRGLKLKKIKEVQGKEETSDSMNRRFIYYSNDNLYK